MSDHQHKWVPSYSYIEPQESGADVLVEGWECELCDATGETYSFAEAKDDWSADLDRYIDKQLKELGR